MIPGSKAHAFHACMKKHGFMTRKIRASSHFSEKNARIASILGLRKHIVRSNPCIIHPVILSPLSYAFHACMKKHGFMTRKIRASSHFSEKNARIASILGLRKHIVRSNPCIIHPVILSPLSCSAHILLLFPHTPFHTLPQCGRWHFPQSPHPIPPPCSPPVPVWRFQSPRHRECR